MKISIVKIAIFISVNFFTKIHASADDLCRIAIKNPNYFFHLADARLAVDLNSVEAANRILKWNGSMFFKNVVAQSDALKWHSPGDEDLLSLKNAMQDYTEGDFHQFYRIESSKHRNEIINQWLYRTYNNFMPYWVTIKETGLLSLIGDSKRRAGEILTYSGGNFKDDDYTALKNKLINPLTGETSNLLRHLGVFSTSSNRSTGVAFMGYQMYHDYHNLVLFNVTGVNGLSIVNSAEKEIYYPPGSLFLVKSVENDQTFFRKNLSAGVEKEGNYPYQIFEIEELYSTFRPKILSNNELAAEITKVFKTSESTFPILGKIKITNLLPFTTYSSKISLLEQELFNDLLAIAKKFTNESIEFYRKNTLLLSKNGKSAYTQDELVRLLQNPYIAFVENNKPVMDDNNLMNLDLYIPKVTYEAELKKHIKVLANALAQPSSASVDNLHKIAAIADFIYLNWGLTPFNSKNEEIFNYFVSYLLFRAKIAQNPLAASSISLNPTGLKPVEIYYNIIQHWLLHP